MLMSGSHGLIIAYRFYRWRSFTGKPDTETDE